MEGIDVPFNKVQELSGEQIYAHIKKSFLKARAPTRSTCSAPAGATLKIIATPGAGPAGAGASIPVTARVWEFQKWLNVNGAAHGLWHYAGTLP